MISNENQKPKSISGKSQKELTNEIFQRVIKLKLRLINQYHKMYQESSLDHVRKILVKVENSEKEDMELIKSAMETGSLDELSPDSQPVDYEMLDHIIAEDSEETDPNDLRSVLMFAMKMSNDFSKIFSLMAEEHKGLQLTNALRVLTDRELEMKNYLTNLYDDLINKDYW